MLCSIDPLCSPSRGPLLPRPRGAPPHTAPPGSTDSAHLRSQTDAVHSPVRNQWQRGAPPLQVPCFAQTQLGTGTSLPSRTRLDLSSLSPRRRRPVPTLQVCTDSFTLGQRPGLPDETSTSLCDETAAAGESEGRVFLKQTTLCQSECAKVNDAYLTGDPWYMCEDLLLEDHVEWFMDFLRERDAARPERPEDFVNRVRAENKPRTRLLRRLEAIVREPIYLLDPLLSEEASKRKPPPSYDSETSSPRSPQHARKDFLFSDLETTEGSTASPGLGSVLSLASFRSSESVFDSRASLWLGSSPPPSSPGISELETAPSSPTRRCTGQSSANAAETWEMEFVAQCAIDEVWTRLKDGGQAQDICQILSDTRKHLVTCQVRRQRGLTLTGISQC